MAWYETWKLNKKSYWNTLDLGEKKNMLPKAIETWASMQLVWVIYAKSFEESYPQRLLFQLPNKKKKKKIDLNNSAIGEVSGQYIEKSSYLSWQYFRIGCPDVTHKQYTSVLLLCSNLETHVISEKGPTHFYLVCWSSVEFRGTNQEEIEIWKQLGEIIRVSPRAIIIIKEIWIEKERERERERIRE